MKHYIRLARPEQWVKNIFLFLPLFFDHKFTNPTLFGLTIVGALAFSLMASSIYILNDYFDREADRKHPTKKNRPLASGKAKVVPSIVFMCFLFLGGLSICFLLPASFSIVLVIYFVVNLGYNFGLKHIPLLDVFVLSSGYLMRVYGGGFISDIEPSAWLGIMTFFMALFLALAKRRDDMVIYLDMGTKSRKVLDGYNLQFLNVGLAIMASVIIVAYAMYTINPETLMRFKSPHLYLTIIPVVLGLLRYLQITFVEKNSGSPTQVFYKDTFLQLVVVSWAVSLYLLIYL